MDIASRIENINNNLKNAYDSIEGLGIDIGEKDKNLENLSVIFDEIYEEQPKVTGEGANITLNNTKKGRLGVDLNGDLSQKTTNGYNLLPYNQLTSSTINGITFTPIFEGNNLLYIKATGLASANATYRFYGIDTITPQKVFDSAIKISFGLIGSSSTYGLAVWGLNSGGVNIGAEIYDETEYAIGFQLAGIGLRVHSGANVNIEFKPMIRLSTITDDSYEPYTGNQPSPNPNYPQEIKVVSGNQNVKIHDKNFFDKNNVRAGYRFGSDGDYYTWSGYNASEYINVKPNTTYSTSWVITIMECVCTYDINKNFIRRIQTGRNFTTTLTEYYIRADVSDTNLATAQIEPGSTATTYETYQSQTYPLSLGSLELAKIGNYKDYIYKENGKWYKYSAIGKVVLTGSENWSIGTTVTSRSVFLNSSIFVNRKDTNSLDDFFSDNFSFLGNAQMIDLGYAMSFNRGENTHFIYIQMPLDIIAHDDLSGFKTWLSTHNTIVYYILETPTITEITDTTLISQLNNLYNAKSYDDTTVITIDGNLPSILNVSALEKDS